MEISRIINYEMNQNCFFVYENDECLVIDPGSPAQKIKDKAEELGLKIKYILLTHCHYDHIEGLGELRKIKGVRLVTSLNCNINIQKPSVNLSLGFGRNISEDPTDIILSDCEEIELCGIKIKCILTPGHTNCSTCFLIGKHLFTGDTLFLRNVGRWDLPTGDEDSLVSSIKNKIYTLDDDILVYSGHGNDSQIGYEKKFNLYVKG